MTALAGTRKRDLGLYQYKYALRRVLIQIPGISALSPNWISLSAAIPGALAACALLKGYWILAILMIFLRMLVSTLDGLVAEQFAKTSRLGAYLNRLPGEFTDLIIAASLWNYAPWPWNLALVIMAAWVQTIGLLGLCANGSIQSVGPCGQTDRLALVMIGALIARAHSLEIWKFWVPMMVFGCGVTLVIRIFRSVRELSEVHSSHLEGLH